MDCSACETPLVAFEVPPALREHAPGEGAAAGICPNCLRTEAVPETELTDAAFSRVSPAMPTGEAGAGLALALGLLDSLALDRAAVVACCEFVERAGGDPLLTLDRLADDPDLDPHVDLDRRRTQLRSLL